MKNIYNSDQLKIGYGLDTNFKHYIYPCSIGSLLRSMFLSWPFEIRKTLHVEFEIEGKYLTHNMAFIQPLFYLQNEICI